MSAPIFVDTNVLVYALDAGAGEKQAQAHRWLTLAWESRRGRVSIQVLQEYYVTLTRKLRPGLQPAEARTAVRALLPWRPVEIGPSLLESAWRVQDRFQVSYWDALIVAAAHAAGCRYLLTEDLRDGQDLEGLLVVNPFVWSPETVPA